MSENSGFFNAELLQDGSYDRAYLADSFASYFARFIGNGVFIDPATQLQVVQDTTASMNVRVLVGSAFINGYWYENDTTVTKAIELASGTMNRIDSVVIQWNVTTRDIKLVVKKGTDYTGLAQAQPIVRNESVYELVLAHINIPKGKATITSSDITDKRSDEAFCGFVKGVVDQISTANLFTQFEDSFNQFMATNNTNFDTWFDTIKDKLTTDVAGSLQLEIDAINSSVVVFPTATGTATAITIPTVALVNGGSRTFVASANNNSAATTINGKPVYKPGTTTAPNFISGKAYTIWYSQAGDCFFIKASAEGNTVANHVLAGDTFSTDLDTGIQGSMPNRTGETASIGSSVVNSTIKLKPQEGYFDGINSYVTATDGNYVASNIKAGQPIFGKVGSFTSDANAVAGDILSGKTAYTNGVKLTGTIPTIATNTSPEVVAYWAPGAVGNPYGTAHMRTPPGYYPWGTYLSHAEPDLIADNVRNGKTIFTMVGTGPTKKAAGGTVTSGTTIGTFTYAVGGQINKAYIEVSGLTFKPYTIVVFSSTHMLVYYAGVMVGLNDCVHSFQSLTGSYSANVQEECFQANTGSGYVTASGFRIPVWGMNETFTWAAYE